MQIKSRTNGRNKSNKLQYNVRIRLPKQKCVFSFRRNTSKDGADVMSSDRMFHNVSFLFFVCWVQPYTASIYLYILTSMIRSHQRMDRAAGQWGSSAEEEEQEYLFRQ